MGQLLPCTVKTSKSLKQRCQCKEMTTATLYSQNFKESHAEMSMQGDGRSTGLKVSSPGGNAGFRVSGVVAVEEKGA